MKNHAKNDVYQIITDLIIEKLESGVIPWQKPWTSYGLACNYLTRKPYTGINQLILLNLHARPFYLTFLQAKELGGTVKKGSKSLPITYWNIRYKNKDTGKTISRLDARSIPEDQLQVTPILKYYRVFNIDDIEGVDFDIPELPKKNRNQVLESCEKIIANMPNPPEIRHQMDQAFYMPSLDYINMPNKELFVSSEMYYSILFHEVVHSSGHKSRLNRPEVNSISGFASHDYRQEELTAEIGASFLNCQAGILNNQTLQDSAAYIQGWLRKLKNDKRFIIDASAKAQKAVNFILNQQGD